MLSFLVSNIPTIKSALQTSWLNYLFKEASVFAQQGNSSYNKSKSGPGSTFDATSSGNVEHRGSHTHPSRRHLAADALLLFRHLPHWTISAIFSHILTVNTAKEARVGLQAARVCLCERAAGNSSHKAEGNRLFNGVKTLCVVMAIRGDISLQMLASWESERPAASGWAEPWDTEDHLSHNESQQPRLL